MDDYRFNMECLASTILLLGAGDRRANPSISLQEDVKRSTTTCACIAGREFSIPVDLVNVMISSNSIHLPKGSKHNENQFFHEIEVTPVEPIPVADLQRMMSFRPIEREALKKHDQISLHDTPSLNVIQSQTFEVAYKTDQNMLVCAPTGAGKTLISLMCVLRELTHYPNIHDLKKSPFKIVYIAPMKALACEIALNFQNRLEPLGLTVREFTGDMHLYAHEVENTDMLVTTPEKYDAVTRRDTGETSLFQTVHLLIVDEVHMLNSDRGPVLEAIIARMFRLREIKKSRLRIVGLSATLPNYREIAEFLHVDPLIGLFYFGWGFRPIPLKQTFVGTRNSRIKKHWEIADQVCYAKTLEFIKKGKQVLIFLHSRANTIQTAIFLEKTAEKEDDLNHFMPIKDGFYSDGLEMLKKSKQKKLNDLYSVGIGYHHAGMLREDRQLVEDLFRGGYIKVLISTATLAWGVNLPAYAVIIKGTRLYSPNKGSMVNIDLLDVQQMFGRAGRPQYDEMGEAVLITQLLELPLYLSLFQWTVPIQSQLQENLVDHLNAEISLCSVGNLDDGVSWLRQTFMYIRMNADKTFYKIRGTVDAKCSELIRDAVLKLIKCKMINYDVGTGQICSTDVGRIASHSYICHETIKIINEFLETSQDKSLAKVLVALSKSKEFNNLKIRQDEERELNSLCELCCTDIPTRGLPEGERKMIILLQSWMSRVEIKLPSVYLDQVFTSQNAGRVLRAMFDIAVVKRLAVVSRLVLDLKKSIVHKMLLLDHPIFQMKRLPGDQYGYMIADTKITMFELRKLNMKQMVKIVRDETVAKSITKWLKSIPFIDMEIAYHRPTPQLVQIELQLTPNFTWKKNVNHEELEPFLVWVENPTTGVLYPPTNFTFNERQAEQRLTKTVKTSVMLNDDEIELPPNLVLHVLSEYWLGIDIKHKMRKNDLMAPSGAKSVFNIIEETQVNGYPEATPSELSGY